MMGRLVVRGAELRDGWFWCIWCRSRRLTWHPEQGSSQSARTSVNRSVAGGSSGWGPTRWGARAQRTSGNASAARAAWGQHGGARDRRGKGAGASSARAAWGPHGGAHALGGLRATRWRPERRGAHCGPTRWVARDLRGAWMARRRRERRGAHMVGRTRSSDVGQRVGGPSGVGHTRWGARARQTSGNALVARAEWGPFGGAHALGGLRATRRRPERRGAH
jgi:hypothetical protein